MENVITLVNPEDSKYCGVDHITYIEDRKLYTVNIVYKSPERVKLSEMYEYLPQLASEISLGTSFVLENLKRWEL